MVDRPAAHLAAEIATQPADWRAVLARVDEALAVLPPRGARVAVTGCGTSFYMAQAYATLRETSGTGPTDAYAASEFPLGRDYDHVVAISRSGTTTEVIDLLERLRERSDGPTTTALVATAGTAIPDAGHPRAPAPRGRRVLRGADPVRHHDPRAAASHAGRGPQRRHRRRRGRARRGRLHRARGCPRGRADHLRRSGLDRRAWPTRPPSSCASRPSSGPSPIPRWSTGTARSASRRPGGRRGPSARCPAGLDEDVRATGAHFEHRAIDPLADLLRVHRLCLAKAEQAGVDPDRPRHLSRSIILT